MSEINYPNIARLGGIDACLTRAERDGLGFWVGFRDNSGQFWPSKEPYAVLVVPVARDYGVLRVKGHAGIRVPKRGSLSGNCAGAFLPGDEYTYILRSDFTYTTVLDGTLALCFPGSAILDVNDILDYERAFLPLVDIIRNERWEQARDNLVRIRSGLEV